MSTFSIIVNHLKVKLQGKTVLNDLSFQLSPGHHLAILGPSGSGKTTLAKALSGHVYFQGSVIMRSEQAETGNVLLVEQRNEFRNRENLNSFYYQQRYNSTESEDAATVTDELNRMVADIFKDQKAGGHTINQLLQRFHLEDSRHKSLIQLSNGEHKKLQLVSALLLQPDVLILDQPFTGLDIQSRKELHSIINHLALTCTVVIITGTNDIPEAITHIAFLENGSLSAFSEKKNFQSKKIASFYHKPVPVSEVHSFFETAVSMRQVSVQFGTKIVLKNICWQVQRGEKWLVRGPNGAGKSTLLSLITGDNPKAYGSHIVLFDKKRGSGESIWDLKRKIGYVSPELHWYFDQGITVLETVASGFFDTMGLYRELTIEQQQTLVEWMNYFDLVSIHQHLLSELPSGKMRLVLLARALVKNPPLLILDEPCQGLDEEQTQYFIGTINELCAASERTLIYVSHYDQEIPSCIDKKLELNKGEAFISEIENNKTAAA